MTVLDLEMLREMREDVPAEAFAAIVATFDRELARLTGVLAAAIEAEDAAGFSRSAHTLAGAAEAVGARDLATVTRRAMQAPDAEEREILLRLIRLQGRAALAELRGLLDATP